MIKTIEETLQKAAEEGFPQERIESLLHQIEINQKNVFFAQKTLKIYVFKNFNKIQRLSFLAAEALKTLTFFLAIDSLNF